MTGIASLLLDALRIIVFYLDALIYSLISSFFSLIMYLARLEIFSVEVIKTFANNIYAILGILMLFRLSFTLLNIIANPDLLTDKDRGIGKILTRAVTALFLIVLIPYGFYYAMRIQTVVIKQNIFLKLFMGVENRTEIDGNKTEIDKINENTGIVLSREALKSFLFISENASNTGILEYNDLSKTFGHLGGMMKQSKVLNGKNSSDEYNITYYLIFSTAAGIFILAILVIFAIDIALRTVKLGFLQVISPVAVVSYIEPTSSEKGLFKRWLDMVIATYLSLFIRLAVLAFLVFSFSIVFTIFQIEDENVEGTSVFHYENANLERLNVVQVGNTTVEGVRTLQLENENPGDINIFPVDNGNDEREANFQGKNEFLKDLNFIEIALLRILVLMGILLFAKEAPQMLSKLFGIEEASIGTLNPFQKIASVPIAGATIGAGLGAVGGAVAGGGLGGAVMGAISGWDSVDFKGDGSKNVLAGFASGRDTVTKLATGSKDVGIGGLQGRLGSEVSQRLLSRRADEELRRGTQLAEQIEESGGDELVIYENDNFKTALTQFNFAKRRERAALVQQNRAQRDYNAGVIDNEQFEKIQRQYYETQGDRELFERRFEEQQKFNPTDAEKHKIYSNYLNYMEATNLDDSGVPRYRRDINIYESPEEEPEIIDLGE